MKTDLFYLPLNLKVQGGIVADVVREGAVGVENADAQRLNHLRRADVLVHDARVRPCDGEGPRVVKPPDDGLDGAAGVGAADGLGPEVGLDVEQEVAGGVCGIDSAEQQAIAKELTKYAATESSTKYSLRTFLRTFAKPGNTI